MVAKNHRRVIYDEGKYRRAKNGFFLLSVDDSRSGVLSLFEASAE